MGLKSSCWQGCISRGSSGESCFLVFFSFCCYLFADSSLTLLWPHGLQPARLLCPWDFPGKNTGVGGHFLLQGIFWLRDGTHVSCIAGSFFTTVPPGKTFRMLFVIFATWPCLYRHCPSFQNSLPLADPPFSDSDNPIFLLQRPLWLQWVHSDDSR